ncbi:PREDICTED: zinc finger protein 280B [Chinchilla lanigera]|uniref:Zinc finger protein 280B n=1 Tax=Chinchilla lanigera TaxID=34839 RepID=A0A8C2WD92_CHILA|nr:PREDICTED: zinc finger protein 280B [Chinchilla lanigera]XP_005396417.1 PREDICTED: zinc finger protein 280B [Chinchilla lanigera]
MEQPCLLREDQDPEPELQKSARETKPEDDEDAELIFVGVEHANEDAELIFVGVKSNSKPTVSNILNRVTPGSCSRRKKYGRFRKNTAKRLQVESTSCVSSPSETVTILSDSSPESRSTDSPIIIEPLSKFVDKNNSSQVVPSSSSELDSPLVILTSSLQHPVKTVLSVDDMNESPCVSKRCSTSEVNSINPKSPKLSDGIVGGISSALSASVNSHTLAFQQSTPSNDVHTSLSHIQNIAPFPAVFPKDIVHFKPTNINTDTENGLVKISSLASQNKNCDPKKGSLILLLSDFYYGQHKGNGQPEPKTHSTFKCLSCLKVLKNVKFMNHMKHHFELEKEKGDSWEKHTTCQHCYRQFPTPFQLLRHIASVHTTEEPSAVCKICELSFETDQALLQHMKDNHKPGEMPYVCQLCNYRSSAFTDVETHFRICHENTKNLLCPFCLKIFKTAAPYVCHYRRHWGKSVNQCSKCRLQFLTFKEKMEHKTQYHQMFKKPEQLEGLPPDTKVVIQVSLEPSLPGSVKVASITVSTIESEPSPLRSKSRISKKIHSF